MAQFGNSQNVEDLRKESGLMRASATSNQKVVGSSPTGCINQVNKKGQPRGCPLLFGVTVVCQLSRAQARSGGA